MAFNSLSENCQFAEHVSSLTLHMQDKTRQQNLLRPQGPLVSSLSETATAVTVLRESCTKHTAHDTTVQHCDSSANNGHHGPGPGPRGVTAASTLLTSEWHSSSVPAQAIAGKYTVQGVVLEDTASTMHDSCNKQVEHTRMDGDHS